MLHKFYYMFICECMCVNRAVGTEKNPMWGSPQWVNKAETAAKKRALGDFSGAHTNLRKKKKKNVKHASCYGPCACALSSSRIIKGQ